MKMRKTPIILILLLTYFMSGCSTNDNSAMESPGTKINTAESISDSDIMNEYDKSVSSDAVSHTEFYVANRNTKKFHCFDCESVSQIKESNKIYCAYDEDVPYGYKPCKKCIDKRTEALSGQ